MTVLTRRACLEEVGGFPTSHDVAADYLTWFRIAARHELEYVPATVADYTVHDEGISSDLGRSLSARIELFSQELTHTRDPGLRATLERLIFNLGIHLGVAAARGRARSVPRPWRVTGHAVLNAASRDAAGWALALLVRQARVRSRRRLMIGPST